MADRYPKSKGGVWANKQRTTDKHPHLKGHVVVTPEQIRKLIEMSKAGLEPRLQLSVWKSETEAGVKWLSISAEVYMPSEDAGKKERGTQHSDDDDLLDIPF